MPVMLGEQVRKITADAPKSTLVAPVKDTAIGLAAKMGGPLNSATVEPGPEGPVFAHTRFFDPRYGVSFSSNGLRDHGLLVAQAEPMSPMKPDSTEALINKRFPLNLAPFSLRETPTVTGLQVVEYDRKAIERFGPYETRPLPLDRGTILVATAAPDAEVRQHEEMAFLITPKRGLTEGQERAWQRKNIQERKYKLTSLDALIDDATAYMNDMNAIRVQNSDKTTVSQRDAINHVLQSLIAPEPADEALANQRRAAGVPANIDPQTLYRRFTHQLHTLHSEITGVTYTHIKPTIQKINRWVNKELKDGANPLSTYYEAAKRTMQSQMQARAEMQRGERVTVDQMIEDAARASQPTPELVFPPLPDVSFFSPHVQEQAAENLAHFAQERESEQIVFQRRHRVPQPAKQ